MTDERDASSSEGSDSHIQAAISMFESIIETMPTDRVSLEALRRPMRRRATRRRHATTCCGWHMWWPTSATGKPPNTSACS